MAEPTTCVVARCGRKVDRIFELAGREIGACVYHAPIISAGGTMVLEGLRYSAVRAAERVGPAQVRRVADQAVNTVRWVVDMAERADQVREDDGD